MNSGPEACDGGDLVQFRWGGCPLSVGYWSTCSVEIVHFGVEPVHFDGVLVHYGVEPVHFGGVLVHYGVEPVHFGGVPVHFGGAPVQAETSIGRSAGGLCCSADRSLCFWGPDWKTVFCPNHRR